MLRVRGGGSLIRGQRTKAVTTATQYVAKFQMKAKPIRVSGDQVPDSGLCLI